MSGRKRARRPLRELLGASGLTAFAIQGPLAVTAMAKKKTISAVIGRGDFGGVTYDSELALYLTDPDLAEATIASAFLTEGGADRILLHLVARPKESRPRITFLIGSMNAFTRKAAVKSLCDFRMPGGARLRVLRPAAEFFHLKSAHFSFRRGPDIAIVGSHNLTDAGIESAGELGVVIEGRESRSIRDVLNGWSAESGDWQGTLRTYRERAGGSPDQPKGAQSKSTRPIQIGAAGQTVLLEEVEHLSRADERRADAIINNLPRSIRKRRLNYILSWDGDEYSVGEYFDDPDWGEPEGEWKPGQKRSISRVLALLPMGERHLVVFEDVIRYKVDQVIAKLAKKLGIDDTPGDGELREYVEYLRKRSSR